ncbi:SpoIIIAC/SpoIIIAD family protein [Bacillus cereus]
MLKIIGIAYIAEFGAQITKDAGGRGEGARKTRKRFTINAKPVKDTDNFLG